MSKITDTTGQVFDLLEPFDSAERHKIVQAALTLLGESPIIQSKMANTAASETETNETSGISKQALVWMKANNLTSSDLSEVFHINDGKVDVIAEIPGSSASIRSVNSYILQGLSSLISSGDPKFTDESARELCVKAGCFTYKNHSSYIKGLGNQATGNKDIGWTLTNPGLKAGALLIKEINNAVK